MASLDRAKHCHAVVSLHVRAPCDRLEAKQTLPKYSEHPTSILLLFFPPCARYTHDARRFVVEAEEAQDKLNAVQNSIFSGNEEMDRFKLQMNWNQEELEQWALAAKQKEEDNLALQKYARADDVKIKELR